jgi:hypothetical protein
LNHLDDKQPCNSLIQEPVEDNGEEGKEASFMFIAIVTVAAAAVVAVL